MLEHTCVPTLTMRVPTGPSSLLIPPLCLTYPDCLPHMCYPLSDTDKSEGGYLDAYDGGGNDQGLGQI